MDDVEKRQRANRQREASRLQVQRNVKFTPEVSARLDVLMEKTGLTLGRLIAEALEIAERKLVSKFGEQDAERKLVSKFGEQDKASS